METNTERMLRLLSESVADAHKSMVGLSVALSADTFAQAIKKIQGDIDSMGAKPYMIYEEPDLFG